MSLIVVGVNHRTAALALRDRLAVSSCELPATLFELRTAADLEEVVILSTCNRLECYGVTQDPTTAYRHVAAFLARRAGLAVERVHARLYGFTDVDAVQHGFRVAAGLDSMILGESEIAAQVKQAYHVAHAAGATGVVLNRLFQKAIHSAKVVRFRTRIAEGQASIGSVVVALTRNLFANRLQDRQVLLWGAGKAAETTARHLIKQGVQKLWIVNRTAGKAQELAALCQGGWLSWEQALRHLAHVDVAIVCTQAPHYVIDEADLAAVWPQRGGRPLLIVDLAVPRNVDPILRQHPGVRLYNIDDLQSIAQIAVAQRQGELISCETLIHEQVGQFVRWWSGASHKEQMACRIAGQGTEALSLLVSA
ncbi:MAG: glutamyl-tRNA reductase [Candidatus Omnitrophica bacterium]|nr:glutamyl-tRNA reductase [Candidatus Omnitrophota bacterium]